MSIGVHSWFFPDDWADLDGQEQIETLLTTRLKALKNERAEVKLLLEALLVIRVEGNH